MILYKAVCKKHDWGSPALYKKKANAIRSAQAHRRNIAGPHEIVILEVYIPENTLQVKSEIKL